MSIPKLKRVTIRNIEDLAAWLARQGCDGERVMLVLFSKAAGDKFLDRDLIDETLDQADWHKGRAYTLNGNQIGQVINPNP